MNPADAAAIAQLLASTANLLLEFEAARAAGNQEQLDAVRDRIVAASNALKPPGGVDAVAVL